MEKLFIVFDRIPSSTSGGLVTYYMRLANMLKDYYDVVIISIFDTDEVNKKLFEGFNILNISNFNNDLMFVEIVKYIKAYDIINVIKSIYKVIYNFCFIKIARSKTKKIINTNKCIVSSPSAGIFVSNKIKFILEIHTKYEFFWGDRFISKLQVKLMSKPQLILFRSKSDKNKAINQYTNVDYIYNFLDNSDINRKQDVFPTNKYLFLGRLSYEKNLFRLLDIAELLKHRNVPFNIDIYGNGPLKQELQENIIQKGLNDKVILKGFCTNKNIYKEYDALLLTSDIEGYPLVIIEAKANAIPTITTNWGDATSEIIADKENGIICETNDMYVNAVIAMQNPDCLKKMSNAAFDDFINNYSASIVKSKWLDILSREG